MDRFQQMQVFTAVAEEQGFAAAARRLQMSPPVVSRAIASLEERLGVKLLQRTTRSVRTTEAGKRYLEDSKRILDDMAVADEAAAGINVAPRGKLAITAPVLFGRLFVMPSIVEYLGTYPEVAVEAVFLDRVVNLLEEGLDVGIRIGELADSSMRALKVGTIRRVTVASPVYLKKAGIPLTPEDLKDHDVITSTAGSGTTGWQFHSPEGALSPRLQPRLSCSTNDAAIAAACQSLGVTNVLSYQVAKELRAGSLQIVLEQFETPPRPIHIVHREDRFSSSKVRSFIDLLGQRLRANTALN